VLDFLLGLPVSLTLCALMPLLSVENLLVMNIRDLRGRVPVLMDAEFLRVMHKALILSDTPVIFLVKASFHPIGIQKCRQSQTLS
jgi:hypothetical protein